MTDASHPQTLMPSSASSFAERRVLDALYVDGREAWALLAREVEDLIDLLDLESDPEPLLVCRRVDPDGTIVLGTADPERDPLLSFVVEGCGRGAD